MDNERNLTPVRYRDAATTMSRPTFSKYHAKIIGDIYLHREVADQPDKITDALLTRHPQGVLRGFSGVSPLWGIWVSRPTSMTEPR